MNFIIIFLCLINYAVSTTSAKPMENNTVDTRIVGGDMFYITSAPYQAYIHLCSDYMFCGGSILSSTWVVTAAHCTILCSHENYRVYVGITHIAELEIINPFKVLFSVTHDTFKLTEVDCDISLLKLAKELQFFEKVKPIPLTSREPIVGSSCTVTGYGSVSEGGELSNVLKGAFVEIRNRSSPSVTQLNSVHKLTANMLFAGGLKGLDSCQGDSGGPLACWNEQLNIELCGIVSWGYGCGRNGFPGVYTNVYKLLNWIKGMMSLHS